MEQALKSLKPFQQLTNLSGKGAIVTGGSMGIGRGIAWRLAEAGAGVTITGRRKKFGIETVEEIKDLGGKAQFVEADVTSSADIKKVIDATVDVFGSIDILVNNASDFPITDVLQITEEEWDRVTDIDQKAPFFYAQAFAKELIKRGHGGSIINIGSIDGLRPYPGHVHYNTIKGGYGAFTMSLALELGKYNIRANNIVAGAFNTPGTDAIMENWAREKNITLAELKKPFFAKLIIPRQGEPEEIGNAALFLASDASSYITGATLVVDGGFMVMGGGGGEG